MRLNRQSPDLKDEKVYFLNFDDVNHMDKVAQLTGIDATTFDVNILCKISRLKTFWVGPDADAYLLTN